MFRERHTSSLLKRGNVNGKSKLEIQESLENLLKADQDYIKIDVQIPSEIRKETILWMLTQTYQSTLPRDCFFKAVDRYDLMFSEETSNDPELHKLVGLAALCMEGTTDVFGNEGLTGRDVLEEYFPIVSEEVFAEMEESLLQEEEISEKTADYYLDNLVLLLEDSTASNEENKTVWEMREVLFLCILEKRCRMFSPLALAAGVYFWFARGAQAPWLQFLSSMCSDISDVIDWVAPKVKIVNGRRLKALRSVS